jgi:hypothetical protein
MISLERWTELIADCPSITVPKDEAEYERLKVFVPVPTVAALAVRNAYGPDRMPPWWAK